MTDLETIKKRCEQLIFADVQTDMRACIKEIERLQQPTMDDLICQFTEDLHFDALEDWCAILSVDYETPPIGGMYPDWEVELRTEIAEAIAKVGVKALEGKQ